MKNLPLLRYWYVWAVAAVIACGILAGLAVYTRQGWLITLAIAELILALYWAWARG